MKKIVIILICNLLILSCKKNKIEYRRSFFKKIESSILKDSSEIVICDKPLFFDVGTAIENGGGDIIDYEKINLKKKLFSTEHFQSVRLVDSIYIQDSIINTNVNFKEFVKIKELGFLNPKTFLERTKAPLPKTIICYSLPYFFNDSTQVLIFKSTTKFYGVYLPKELLLFEYNNGKWEKGILPQK